MIVDVFIFHSVLPSIVNAILITSAFSAANTFIFSASRILYGLAVQKKAPRIFTTCTKDGLPWIAVIASVCITSVGIFVALIDHFPQWLFSFLAFMSVSTSSGTVFKYDLSSL